jgi:hypothetical protein
MLRRTSLILTRFLLILVALCWGVAQDSAPTRKPSRTQNGQQTIITDAAGRVHVRSARITYAQRKAAAQRRVNALRDAAAKRKLAGTDKGEVKK